MRRMAVTETECIPVFDRLIPRSSLIDLTRVMRACTVLHKLFVVQLKFHS